MQSNMGTRNDTDSLVGRSVGRGTLAIKDDHRGIAENPSGTQGMGMHIMNYRAGMIGGALEVRPDRSSGTVVTCLFPVKDGQ